MMLWARAASSTAKCPLVHRGDQERNERVVRVERIHRNGAVSARWCHASPPLRQCATGGRPRRLASWTLLVAAPAHAATPAAYQRAFERATARTSQLPRGWSRTDLAWYLQARHAVEQQQFSALSIADLARFRELTRIAQGTALETLYHGWVANGASALDALEEPSPLAGGRLELCLLPHRYTQFGDLPGVC
jgi:hypothetical protein